MDRTKSLGRMLLGLFFVVGWFGAAQESGATDNPFIRVYNLEGRKIHKGRLQQVSDAGLRLIFNDSLVDVPVASIGKIRTKHSVGGYLLMGSIIGGSMGLGLIRGNWETETSSVYSGEERVVAVVGGTVLGALVGGTTSVFKKSKKFVINGNRAALLRFAQALAHKKKVLDTPQTPAQTL
ncbi:hypothetical protein [Maribacter sp. 2307ULW6-5]|uniref:hypothetical protein n=1 Tax=Maribacter sp. 2307ULW6-5 TaxID=3386275 RepID=UPI0039BC5614